MPSYRAITGAPLYMMPLIQIHRKSRDGRIVVGAFLLAPASCMARNGAAMKGMVAPVESQARFACVGVDPRSVRMTLSEMSAQRLRYKLGLTMFTLHSMNSVATSGAVPPKSAAAML